MPNSRGNRPQDRRPQQANRGRQQSNDIYSSSGRGPRKRRKKKLSTGRKVLNVFIVLFCVILAVAGGVILYTNNLLAGSYKPLDPNDSRDFSLPSADQGELDKLPSVAEITDALHKDDQVLNVLLIGSDDNSNSDTMMLLSLDNKHGKIKLTSFMRDTYVSIPGKSSGKLNSSFGGGVSKVIETIERNFGVDIDKYAEVNFECFEQVISILGGIEMTVDAAEAEQINIWAPYDDPLPGAGTYTLTGPQALAHSRNRTSGRWDWGRTQRQREVVEKTINELKSSANPVQLVQIANQVMPSVSTDLTTSEIYSLAMNVMKYKDYPIEQFRLPSDNNVSEEKITGWGSVLVIDDMKKARADLQAFIYGDGAPEDSAWDSNDRVR